jgi:mannose-6-phosphate isomerase-like protein (cupin superfamily)
MMQPTNTENAEHYIWGEICEGWHLVKREEISIIQERVPPGAAEVKHLHHRARQFFFILAGQATIEIGNTVFLLRQHEGLEVAPLVPHQFRNEADTDVIFLVISVPPSHGDRETVAPTVLPAL